MAVPRPQEPRRAHVGPGLFWHRAVGHLYHWTLLLNRVDAAGEDTALPVLQLLELQRPGRMPLAQALVLTPTLPQSSYRPTREA